MKKYIKMFFIILFLIICFLDPMQYTLVNSTETISKSSDNNRNLYIKNMITPKYLYVISENDMSKAEQTMISTLQGIVASKATNQIYILSSSEPDYKIWLEDLNKTYNIKYKVIRNPWKLLNHFKSYVDGYILYTTFNPPSINNACTLASLKNSIVIDEAIEDNVNKCGLTNLIEDCRNTDKYWAYYNLWNSGLNHSTVLEVSPDKPIALRDYAITSKSLVFYEDDINDSYLREEIFKSMDENSHCLGWGPDEHTNVTIASENGIDVTAADWSYNLSVLSSYPSIPQKQKANKEFQMEDGIHYVTFIMSDGDNQQWMLGSNYSSKNWYGSPHRGNFNLGWSINQSLYYLAPTVFNKYYENASSCKYFDNFVTSPSGNGYMYPSKFPINKLDSYTSLLNHYMMEVNQNYVLILDDEALYKINIWDKYTCHDNIDGLFYLNYNKNNSYKGEIVWSNNKPIVSCRDLLWWGLESETDLVNNINERVKLGYTDIKNPDSYTFVYVHVWSNTMDNVNHVINKLNLNSKVRVVTPDTFMKLINKNVSH